MFTDLPTAQAWLKRNDGQVVYHQISADGFTHTARSAILPTLQRHGATELDAINQLYDAMGSARRP